MTATARKPVPYNQGWGRRHIRKTEPFPPGTICGFLTAEEQLAAGTSRYTRFRCRCGEVVTRMHADVRESMARGALPACLGCREAAKAEAAKRKDRSP